MMRNAYTVLVRSVPVPSCLQIQIKCRLNTNNSELLITMEITKANLVFTMKVASSYGKE